MPERPKYGGYTGPEHIRITKGGTGAIFVTEMHSGDQIIYDPKAGVIVQPRSDNLLSKLNAMKALNQSLPDFLRELSGGDKSK